jgi:hypothetical protein
MLLCNSHGLTNHATLLVHLDCLLWVFGSDIASLCLGKVILLLESDGLLDLHSLHALWVVLSGDLDG